MIPGRKGRKRPDTPVFGRKSRRPPDFWPRRMGFKAPENLRPTPERPPPAGKPQTSRVRGRRRA